MYNLASSRLERHDSILGRHGQNRSTVLVESSPPTLPICWVVSHINATNVVWAKHTLGVVAFHPLAAALLPRLESPLRSSRRRSSAQCCQFCQGGQQVCLSEATLRATYCSRVRAGSTSRSSTVGRTPSLSSSSFCRISSATAFNLYSA
jgi:hypothetical protein